LIAAALVAVHPGVSFAQDFMTRAALKANADVIPISNNPGHGTLVDFGYGATGVETGAIKVTAVGVVDTEPAGTRRFYYTYHDQIVRMKRLPVGFVLEEGALRNAGGNAMVGITTNFNELPGIRVVTGSVMKAFNVTWLKVVSGNVQDDVKIGFLSKDLPLGFGFLDLEGYYRIRYGSADNFGEPQIAFRPAGLHWLKTIVELKQAGKNLYVMGGVRITLVAK
jgi:hypothetical protein